MPGASVFCSQCGAANPDEAAFCSACGRTISVPAPPAAAVPQRHPLLRPPILAGLVTVLIIAAAGVGLAVLQGNGASDDGDDATDGLLINLDVTPPGAASITLLIPGGWSVDRDNLIVAEQESDLGTGALSGARIRAVVDFDAEIPPPLDREPSGAIAVIEEPQPVQLDGVEGLMVVMSENVGGVEIARGYVVASPPGSHSLLLILEAPASRWDDVRGSLLSAVEID